MALADFSQVIDRHNTNSLKWDEDPKAHAMWVADMDFQAAPCIREALQKRVEHGIFGYSIIPDRWAESYIGWWQRRHGFTMEKDWLIFCTGIVPAISSIVRKLTTPNENVILQTPVYNIFFNSTINNGCRVLESPLVYENGEYSIDFADLEAKMANPQTSLMILCNPHNPVGKIWDRETLAKIGELAKKHSVVVISDEIHCDLTAPGKQYVPFASVSEDCRQVSITCIAPTKCFNIAGLQTAAVSVPNPVLRHKVWRGLNTDEVAEPNAFAVDATIAAFEQGEPWLVEMLGYVTMNKQYVTNFLRESVPQIKVVPAEATYLMWLDCSAFTDDATEFAAFTKEKTGLWVCEGEEYGLPGKKFLRLNVACPRATVEDGMNRLAQAVALYTK